MLQNPAFPTRGARAPAGEVVRPCESGPSLPPFIDSALIFGIGSGISRFPDVALRRKQPWEVGVGAQSITLRRPTLRFRGKVMLGFALVLIISTITMGIAYLGFERVSSGVSTYRNSVSEADLARNIDRELISYRALARYYVVTGKEDDATATLAAEASLKEAVTRSMKDTTNPARLDQVTRLAREFQTFHQDLCRYSEGQA
jgi:hypothetical protein